MNYEEMVKLAYEDIMGESELEKEARTALFRKGFDESREMLSRRHESLKKSGKAPIGNAIDSLIGPNRRSKGYNEPRFKESVELAKKYPEDRSHYILGQAANGPAIKADQMKAVEALSNRGKTLEDIRHRAATKLGLNAVTTRGLNGPVVKPSRISQNPALSEYMSKSKSTTNASTKVPSPALDAAGFKKAIQDMIDGHRG